MLKLCIVLVLCSKGLQLCIVSYALLVPGMKAKGVWNTPATIKDTISNTMPKLS